MGWALGVTRIGALTLIRRNPRILRQRWLRVCPFLGGRRHIGHALHLAAMILLKRGEDIMTYGRAVRLTHLCSLPRPYQPQGAPQHFLLGRRASRQKGQGRAPAIAPER